MTDSDLPPGVSKEELDAIKNDPALSITVKGTYESEIIRLLARAALVRAERSTTTRKWGVKNYETGGIRDGTTDTEFTESDARNYIAQVYLNANPPLPPHKYVLVTRTVTESEWKVVK